MAELYQPEKYKVYQGAGTSVGFCTVWNEPELIFKQSEAIQENVALLGTLYSRQGVNVIIRNLALNPQIRKLFVWGNGALSNTQYGLAGKSILQKIWAGGVDETGTVRGTEFKLESEIDPGVVEKIRVNVELVEISEKTFEEAETMIEASGASLPAYMEPVHFPDHVAPKVDTFPSEEVGFLVRGHGILDTWQRVVERIMRYGTIKKSQYYNYQYRELIGVTWVVSEEDPVAPNLTLASDWPEELRSVVGATETAIKEYHSVFLNPELPSGMVYTYGNRLNAYPAPDGPLNQVEEILKKQLRGSADTLSAVATTLVPWLDKNQALPCIAQVQCLTTRGKVHLLVTVRSHDIFKAAVPNAFGLRMLQKTIADDVGLGLGKLQITSQSAHIYEQDWENASKLAKCAYWEREPSMTFTPETESDPRGSFLITVEGEKIIAVFQGPTGDELMKIEGESAKKVGYIMAHLELPSLSKHMLDIGMELQKAEMALQKKVPYKQDKPLVL